VFAAEFKKDDIAVRILRSHIERDRLAHTYVFSGEDVALKRDLAKAFACALNDAGARGFEDFSGNVSRRIWEGAFPDVRWFGEDAAARSLKIGDVRTMIEGASLKPFEADWKVFVIEGAERLTIEAQNALLKILEEPPAQTVFCLLAASKDHLLETIQSRAFEIRMGSGGVFYGQKPLDHLPLGWTEKTWDELLEGFQSSARHEVSGMLGDLMEAFRGQLLREAEAGRNQKAFEGRLKAVDAVMETKEALEANANQKLALTRLTVRLNAVLPKHRGS